MNPPSVEVQELARAMNPAGATEQRARERDETGESEAERPGENTAPPSERGDETMREGSSEMQDRTAGISGEDVPIPDSEEETHDVMLLRKKRSNLERKGRN